ncbi:hypothetical protein DFH09DRAFT_1085489 [Mycena vulgaris]|nr:hypothetical protein DFH09DRAFT_1085489 [Mycena vulgaris]
MIIPFALRNRHGVGVSSARGVDDAASAVRSGPQTFPEPVFGFGFGFGSGPGSDLNLTVATLGGTRGVGCCGSAFDGHQAQFIRVNFKNRVQIDTDAGAPDFGPDFGRNGQPSGPGNDASWRQVGASQICERDNPSPYAPAISQKPGQIATQMLTI